MWNCHACFCSVLGLVKTNGRNNYLLKTRVSSVLKELKITKLCQFLSSHNLESDVRQCNLQCYFEWGFFFPTVLRNYLFSSALWRVFQWEIDKNEVKMILCFSPLKTKLNLLVSFARMIWMSHYGLLTDDCQPICRWTETW